MNILKLKNMWNVETNGTVNTDQVRVKQVYSGTSENDIYILKTEMGAKRGSYKK